MATDKEQEEQEKKLEKAANPPAVDGSTAEVKPAKTYPEIREDVKKAYDDIYGEGGSFYQIVEDKRKQYEDAQDEEARRRKVDYNTAKWTAVTEAAASLANLIGVGGYGATSQQYHQYSQDWMKKADADSKDRRSRIDRLREQQRELESQLEAGRLKGAMALAQLDEAEREAQIKGDIAKINADASIRREEIRQEGAKERTKATNESKERIASGNNQTKKTVAAGNNATKVTVANANNASQERRTEATNASRERTAEKKGGKEVPAEKVIENL